MNVTRLTFAAVVFAHGIVFADRTLDIVGLPRTAALAVFTL